MGDENTEPLRDAAADSFNVYYIIYIVVFRMVNCDDTFGVVLYQESSLVPCWFLSTRLLILILHYSSCYHDCSLNRQSQYASYSSSKGAITES
jgi:hypothetical protein